VELADPTDRGQGWDLLLRVINPITDTILPDEVPAQCKNYQGPVRTMKPIEDLERCVQHSDSRIAYLFILGDLSDEFMDRLEEAQLGMERKLARPIECVVVDQDQIAALYLTYMVDAEQMQAKSDEFSG